MTDATARVRLVDEPDRTGRTTVTLLGSLRARLTALHTTSAADAAGALTSGLCALGREAARTAEGARLREAIRARRAGANAELLWSALLIDRWASAMPPGPVLQDFRNDLALVLCDDLQEALDLPAVPAEPYGSRDRPDEEDATGTDFIVGLWVFAEELRAGIAELAAPSDGATVVSGKGHPPVAGPLLR
ncbi:hypothetical protein [Streptomyces sp. NPDC051001]|uniref:hypothetical protein n=1 Tax=Streptomyces sp. NPDC051001 TaxID=3155795 RepID=UPI0034219D51